MPEFLEHHARSLYRLLGHTGDGVFTEVRCINVNDKSAPPIATALVDNENDFISWAKKFNGQGNCFVGRNPRNKNREVARSPIVTFDLDPNREEAQATDEQVSLALSEARKIISKFGNGYLGMSGNGALVVFRLGYTGKSNEDTSKAIKQLQDEIRTIIDERITCDSTHDAARLIKLLGTVSTKGGEGRTSRFLSIPNSPFAVSKSLTEYIRSHTEQSKSNSDLSRGKVLLSGSTTVGLSFASRLRSAEDALDRMASNRADDYDTWLKVGIALKEFGPAGLSMWREWSKKSAKYTDGVCESKWGTFREDQNITVGSLVYWADQDKPRSSVSVGQGTVERAIELFSPNGNLADHKRKLLAKSRFETPELATGIGILDKYTWGLRRGEIFTIGARTGIGKTSIASCITKNLLRSGKRVLFFTTEMSRDLILERLLSSISGLNGSLFQTGKFTVEHELLLDAAYRELEQFGERLAICDLSSPEIGAVRTAAVQHRPDVLVFDHIQHIKGASDSARSNISEFIRGLKDISRENACAVVVLSQLRRMFADIKTHKTPEPTMSDLKECGTIEEESGQVLLLSMLSENEGSAFCNLLGDLAKNRFGETVRLGIEFDRATANFKEVGTHETQNAQH